MKTQLHQPSLQLSVKSAISPIRNFSLLTDRELVDRYIEGNEQCLEVLIDRHKKNIFNFILKRTRNRDLAEDVFQETFFKVIRSLKSGVYNEEDKFIQWVMRISRNMIIDAFRRNSRIRMLSCVKNSDGEYSDIFNVMDVGERINPGKNVGIEKRQAHRNIRHLIKQLPYEQKQVLIMREYFDMSFNEICKTTKMKLNTALSRMRYALINLRKMIKEEHLSYQH